MNFIKTSFLIVFLSGSFLAQTKTSDAKTSREMTGIWHATQNVGSGMNDLYRFHSDGRFSFEYNQMVWSKKTISYSGKWRIKNRKLILTITKETIVVGGKQIKSDMSADGYEIAGGKEITRKLKSAKIKTETLGILRQDELTKFISISKIKYWRLSKNPKDYGN